MFYAIASVPGRGQDNDRDRASGEKADGARLSALYAPHARTLPDAGKCCSTARLKLSSRVRRRDWALRRRARRAAATVDAICT